MYTMRPEDRLWLVTRQQEELREGMALERAAAAAGTTARPGARGAWATRAVRVGSAAQHLLHSMRGRPTVAPHGATR
jgi:hypothetical protein